MSADAEFTRLAQEYLDDRAERHPTAATDLGDHRFDDRLADPTEQGRPGWRRSTTVPCRRSTASTPR